MKEIKVGKEWALHVENAWDPCILCLDGGGVKSYSSLLILKSLMHEIWMWESRLADEDEDFDFQKTQATTDCWTDADVLSFAPNRRRHVPPESDLLPCHYFDFFIGVSSGGIIATLLGRLRMTVDEAVEAFLDITRAMFGQRTKVVIYDPSPMESCIRAIVKSRCHIHADCTGDDLFHESTPANDGHLSSSFDIERPRRAQTCCLCTLCNATSSPRDLALCTHSHVEYTEDSLDWIVRSSSFTITQVLRATTATPMYFPAPETTRFNKAERLVDGAFGEINTSKFTFSKLNSLWGREDEAPALLLSVGTCYEEDPITSHINRLLQRFISPRPFLRKRHLRSLAELPEPMAFLAWPLLRLLKHSAAVNLRHKRVDDEKKHREAIHRGRGRDDCFRRLDVYCKTADLAKMAIDDWQDGPFGSIQVSGGATLRRIHDATMDYLNIQEHYAVPQGSRRPTAKKWVKDHVVPEARFDPGYIQPPRQNLRLTAEKLVRHRKAREAEGGEKYEVFVGK